MQTRNIMKESRGKVNFEEVGKYEVMSIKYKENRG